MKKISDIFILVGTNPYKHLENFLYNLNNYEIGEEFLIDKDDFSIKDAHNNEIVFKTNAKSTLEQNIRCWIAFKFIKKRNQTFMKICDPVRKIDELIEIAKINLLTKDYNLIKDHSHEYKNTILLKLLFLNDENKIKNKKLYTNKNNQVTSDQIMKEIGKFEKEISKDKTYIEIIKKLEMEDF